MPLCTYQARACCSLRATARPLPRLWAASCPRSRSSPTPHLQACPSVQTDPGPGCSNAQFTESQEQDERGSSTLQDVLHLTSRDVCACLCIHVSPWPRPGLSRQRLSQGWAAKGTERASEPWSLVSFWSTQNTRQTVAKAVEEWPDARLWVSGAGGLFCPVTEPQSSFPVHDGRTEPPAFSTRQTHEHVNT